MKLNRRLATVATLSVLSVLSMATSLPVLAQGTVLKVVPHSNLAILDPIWTTAYMSQF